MRSYEAARNLFSFLGFCAWAVIALGVVVALMGGTAAQAMARGGGNMQFLMGAAPGVIMSMVGAYGLALVQMGRTSVDSAEYAQQSLDVSRQQLELSKQLLAQSKTTAASYAAVAPIPSDPKSGTQSVAAGATYAGQDTASSGATPTLTDAAGSPQIEQNEQVLLAPARHEIEYKNGSYFVGANQFQSRKVAVEFQEEMRAADSLK